ncbi:hypothetical protein [Antrihabitans cavernicola]|uniref:Uncharacterized protein n=1 Tax=Antrihabitans cavernicola TaxID=2495913 RepID=A0A5A7SKI2_9NOCA|nr:hypothetical protein [Spelaeibacter cavernicola]KAA0024975.1 hypothetical protein FOY51_03415 [Spelaeibacter cavernicola]
MTEQHKPETTGKWAPWWVYVVVIVAANFGKQRLMEGTPIVANIVVTAVLVGGLIALITAVYRIQSARP